MIIYIFTHAGSYMHGYVIVTCSQRELRPLPTPRHALLMTGSTKQDDLIPLIVQGTHLARGPKLLRQPFLSHLCWVS